MSQREDICKSWNAYYDYSLKKIMIPVSGYDVMSNSVVTTEHSFPIESAKEVLNALKIAVLQAEKDLLNPIQK